MLQQLGSLSAYFSGYFSSGIVGSSSSSPSTGSSASTDSSATTSAGSTSATSSTSSAANGSTARKLLMSTVWSAIGQPGQTGGIHALAAALSSQLSAGLSSGQDLAPQLTQQIDTALDQVAQQLTAKGIDASHVQKLIGRFRQELSDALGAAAAQAAAASSTNTSTTGTASGSSSGTDSSATPVVTAINVGGDSSSATSTTGSSSTTANSGASSTSGTGTTGTTSTTTSGTTNAAGTTTSGSTVSNFAELALVRESETLKIQTTDGAQVTIRFRAQGAGFATSQTQADGSTATSAAIFSSGRLSVAINGNLTSDDVQAISNVISQVDAIATQFFSGDAQDAFAAAASVNADPNEIAGFSLSLSYSSALYQQVANSTAASSTSSSTSNIPAAASSGTTTASTTSDTSSSTSGASTSGTSSSSDTSSSTASSGTSATSGTSSTSSGTSTTATPQQIIASFVQSVMSKLGRSSGDGPAVLSASWKLKLLAEALPAYATQQTGASGSSGTTSTTQAAKLAAATLTRLAA